MKFITDSGEVGVLKGDILEAERCHRATLHNSKEQLPRPMKPDPAAKVHLVDLETPGGKCRKGHSQRENSKKYKSGRKPSRELYGWVDEEIFTQPSVVEADALPELRREMRLTVDQAAEGDFVLEAASPSDRLPFRAQEDRAHYLWLYIELFTRLGVRLPFTDFQREVLSRCRVAASQLHLNGWVSFAPLSGCACISASSRHGAFFSTLINFTLLPWKGVLPIPGKQPFWLDHEGAPFLWVYWNAEVGDFRITALDPLETLASEFLQSLPVNLGKKSNFKCRWILDHSDADVGAFLDSLLKDMDKQSRFDHLMQRMKEAEGAGPRSILPSSKAQTTVSGTSASGPVAPASIPASSVPPAHSSGASKAAGKSTSATTAKPFSVEREEGVREDQVAD
ncbi:hypothetical protein PIB30_027669 [Stylosanthes scabra]|uniref:Uncharacterized protein n=1 Tax=Stylosanthes scabra TaxID=79078 RepID=A0ABU6SAH1_9FABA|nr:hypothetical protein [Stylosanthes scabra]